MVMIFKTIENSEHSKSFLETLNEATLIVFAKYYSEDKFNQRPFYKYLVNMMFDIYRVDKLEETEL